MFANTTGNDNVATGIGALSSNTTGIDNFAAGSFALASNTTGNSNAATGFEALANNKQGRDNVATGSRALGALTSGRGNVAIGTNAGKNLTTGSNNVDIANPGVASESGTIRIGTGSQTATFIAGIRGANVGGTAQPVVINSNGRLGTAPAASASTAPLATTVEELTAELKHQQRQIDRLRERVKGS